MDRLVRSLNYLSAALYRRWPQIWPVSLPGEGAVQGLDYQLHNRGNEFINFALVHDTISSFIVSENWINLYKVYHNEVKFLHQFSIGKM